MAQDGRAAIAEEAPWSDGLTDYDQAHLALYARLLDAAADGAAEDEIIRVVLEIDPKREPARGRLCLASHLKRAQWMRDGGYRQLLQR